jgi:hypothetical protein
MISPKEKAIELFDNMLYCYQGHIDEYTAKQCALIAVDEILKNFGTLTEGKQHYAAHCTIQFYEQVKQEIEKL